MNNKTMTVEQARLAVEELISDKDDAVLFTRKMDALIAAVRADQIRIDDERWKKVIKNIVKKWKKDYIPYSQCCEWLDDMDNIIATAKEHDK